MERLADSAGSVQNTSPMKPSFRPWLALLFLVFWMDRAPLGAADQPGVIPEFPRIAASATKVLQTKEGQRITVTGKVSDTGISSSGIHFVNFESSKFTLVTFAQEVPLFDKGGPAGLYDGKTIEVTGVIELYKGQPQIKLTSPAMIKVIAAGDPPKASP